jgi:hypothetical protein
LIFKIFFVYKYIKIIFYYFLKFIFNINTLKQLKIYLKKKNTTTAAAAAYKQNTQGVPIATSRKTNKTQSMVSV